MCAARGARAMMLELSWYEGLGLQARRCFVVSYLAGSLGSVRATVRLPVSLERMNVFSLYIISADLGTSSCRRATPSTQCAQVWARKSGA
eukprot:COSAG06_NODE_13_length_35352_cov_49.626255_1_plen_90_part_00